MILAAIVDTYCLQALAAFGDGSVFVERFVDLDGDPLTGDSDFELRVLQGDANGSGIVTGTDISYVRGRINQTVSFGNTSRADVNLTGTLTGTDISFVRSRIGDSAP